MRVAIVWNDPAPLSQCSFRFEAYVDGLRRLGHEPVVVCTRRSADGFPVPVYTVERAEDFDRAETWRAVGASVAFVVTWLRMSKMLEALRAAGARIVAITDSDGQVGVVVHPRAALVQAVADSSSLPARYRIVAGTLRRLARRRDPPSAQELEHLDSATASDVVIFGNRRSAECFGNFVRHYGRESLVNQVAIVPPAIHDVFLRVPIVGERPPRLVAVGRWQATQKNAPLLASALRRVLAMRTVEVDIFGVGGDHVFGRLGKQFPSLRVRGTATPDVIARVGATSRAFVFASRWEGAPHAAAEALATGATVVGTPIPCFLSLADEGLGTVAHTSSPAALATAILEELGHWDHGRRDAGRISGEWRQRVSGEAVSRALLEALERRVKALESA